MSLSDVNENVTVHVHERNGSILTINSRPVLFSEFVKTYFKMTGLSYCAHVFRIIHDGRLIPLDLDVMMPSGSNHINIYVFHAPPSRYPDFFGDIVPRLLDMKYGPDIAVLINTCTIARTCPCKSNGYLNWQHDITYRASKDSKWKVGSYMKKKDNWLHYRHLASVALKKTKKIAFFKEHRVPSLYCDHSYFMEYMKDETDASKLRVCQCKRSILCNYCVNEKEDDAPILMCDICHSVLCDDCDRYFCEAGNSPDCTSELCGKCKRNQKLPGLDCECHTFCCPPCVDFNRVKSFKCIKCDDYKCVADKVIKCSRCNDGLCSECDSHFDDFFSECQCHGYLCEKCLFSEGVQCVRCRKSCCMESTTTKPLQCSFPGCNEGMCETCVESGYDINSLASEGWTVSETTGEPLCESHLGVTPRDYEAELSRWGSQKICD